MQYTWRKGAAIGAIASVAAMGAVTPAVADTHAAAPRHQAAAPATASALEVTHLMARAAGGPGKRGYFNVYQYRNYSGKRAAYKWSMRSLGWMNKRASSVGNRTFKVACIYAQKNYRGHFPGYPRTKLYIPKDSYGNLKRQVDNRIQSFKFARSARSC